MAFTRLRLARMKASDPIEELSNILYESNPKFNNFLKKALKDGVGYMQVENDSEVKFFDIDEVKNESD